MVHLQKNYKLTLDLHPATAHHPKVFAEISTILEREEVDRDNKIRPQTSRTEPVKESNVSNSYTQMYGKHNKSRL